MASASDVRYAQMQYEDNRALGDWARKEQDFLDNKRGRMGWGRLAGAGVGLAVTAASGPLAMAFGSGLGSWLGSTLGGASANKNDEVYKGKLYKDAADDARRDSIAAQLQMKKMAERGALSDAFSAFVFAGTDMGKAVQSGASSNVAALGSLAPDATLLQRAMHGGKQAISSATGAFSGGVGHIKSSLAAMRPDPYSATDPSQNVGKQALGETFGLQTPEMAMQTGTLQMPTAPSMSPYGGGRKALSLNADFALPYSTGADLTTKATGSSFGAHQLHPLPPELVPKDWMDVAQETALTDLGDISGEDITTKATHPLHGLPPELTNDIYSISLDNAAGQTVPLKDALQNEAAGSPMPLYLQNTGQSMTWPFNLLNR